MKHMINTGASTLPIVTMDGLLDPRTGLGIRARSTVWRWVRKGFFPKPMKVGKRSVWFQKDIIAWQLRQAGVVGFGTLAEAGEKLADSSLAAEAGSGGGARQNRS